MKLKAIGSLLFRRNVRFFSEEQKKGGFVNFVKSAWKQTFPEEEDEVRMKYQRVKEEKRYTKEELDKIQSEIPEYMKGALVSSKEQAKVEEEGFKLSSLIPESVKNKIKETNVPKSNFVCQSKTLK